MQRPSNMKSPHEPRIEPSPKRVRNILTLDERVSAIQAYDCCSMYTKIAKMFNCSWEQIKNIIQNRDAIMELYAATRRTDSTAQPDQAEIRERKIGFLGECLYEYIQRLQYHTQQDITEDIIRTKANEFREIIQIPQFTPNKGWLNHFKAAYNFSLSNRQVTLTRTPPASLDLKDIMTYCTKHKPTVELNFTPQAPVPTVHRWRTEVNVLSIHNAVLKEYQQRRQRKVSFLERALHEYVQRARFHHKTQLSDDLLLDTALELRDLLKIENFQRDDAWLADWKTRFKFVAAESATSVRTPPLSLDLRDILSYCSRHVEKSANAVSVKLAPKENDATVPAFKKIKLVSPQPPAKLKVLPMFEAKQEIIESDVEDTPILETPDVKPKVAELVAAAGSPASPAAPIKTEPSSGRVTPTADQLELPRQVHCNADALKLLRPLEEYALLQENYRAIGLLTQLENIFKNPNN